VVEALAVLVQPVLVDARAFDRLASSRVR